MTDAEPLTRPLLTVFGIPKPFTGLTAIQQRNAIGSWTRLGAEVEVLLFGDEEGTREAARDLGARHIPELARSDYGTPLVSAAFDTATAVSRARLLCYANADILLMRDFVEAAQAIQFRRFLMCGQRWDLDLEDPLDFHSPTWPEDVRLRVERTGRLHVNDAMDYFVFPRGSIAHLPPFAVGRAFWDNWLVFHARAQGLAVIDATRATTVVHQNHGYGHVADGAVAVWHGPEARRNHELAADMLYPFTLCDATWSLVGRSVVPRRHPRAAVRLLQSYLALGIRKHPVIRRGLRTLLRARSP